MIFLPLKKDFVLPREIEFNGQNIKYLVQNEIRDNLYGGEFRNNLIYYEERNEKVLIVQGKTLNETFISC